MIFSLSHNRAKNSIEKLQFRQGAVLSDNDKIILYKITRKYACKTALRLTYSDFHKYEGHKPSYNKAPTISECFSENGASIHKGIT